MGFHYSIRLIVRTLSGYWLGTIHNVFFEENLTKGNVPEVGPEESRDSSISKYTSLGQVPGGIHQ